MTIETIDNLAGFSSRRTPGVYYSHNVMPGQTGLDAYLALVAQAVSGSPARFNWFAERSAVVYAVDTSGNIFSNFAGSWDLRRNPSATNDSSGNGLITDQTGRILYAQNQYLGMYDGTTWTDNWKDMGSSVLDQKGMDTFEDWVIIPHGNVLCLLNITDDSFNDSAFTMPSGFSILMVKSNKTGILVAANAGNRGVILLWDANTQRSISEWIWFDNPVKSICKAGDGWIVTTTKEQWITNGYSLTQKLPPMPDSLLQTQNFNPQPSGTMYVNGHLLTANTNSAIVGFANRHTSGLFVLNLGSGDYGFVPPANGNTYAITMGALFQDSSSNVYCSYDSTIPTTQHFLTTLQNTVPSRAFAIIGPFGKDRTAKIARNVAIDMSLVPINEITAGIMTADIIVKIYNFKRQLWAHALTASTSTSEDELTVLGNGAFSTYSAQVGDEVTIRAGANAGQVRHITAIANAHTATETWTLDSNLPNLTEASVVVSVQPFQLVAKHSISLSSLDELKDQIFDIKNRVKGRKFLVKVLIDNISILPLTLEAVSLTYDEQGINKTQ